MTYPRNAVRLSRALGPKADALRGGTPSQRTRVPNGKHMVSMLTGTVPERLMAYRLRIWS
jgi:hypothetical protein